MLLGVHDISRFKSELMFCFTMTNNYSHVLVYIGAELSMAFHYLFSLLRAAQIFVIQAAIIDGNHEFVSF